MIQSTLSIARQAPAAGSMASGDGMASKKTLNQDNLAALGPERLATILIDVAAGNAEIKRRLRLELAAQAGGGDALAAEVGKRLPALRAARSFVDWQKRREFLKDLDQQRRLYAFRLNTSCILAVKS